MSISKEQETRIIVYSLLTLIVGVGGFLFYLGWKDARFSVSGSTVDTNSQITAKYAETKIDPSSVTSSPKFRELEPVNVPSDFGVEQPTTSTGTIPDYKEKDEFSPDKLSKVPRRNGNPFKPF